MPGFLDIANRIAKTVTVNGESIPVYGISFDGIAALFVKFPEAKELLKGQELSINFKDLDPEVIIKRGPALAGALLAAAVGEPESLEAEAAVRRLGFGAQIDILQACFEQTAPEGFGPLVEKLQSLGVLTGTAGAPTDSEKGGPASTSPKPTSKPPQVTDGLPSKSAA